MIRKTKRFNGLFTLSVSGTPGPGPEKMGCVKLYRTFHITQGRGHHCFLLCWSLFRCRLMSRSNGLFTLSVSGLRNQDREKMGCMKLYRTFHITQGPGPHCFLLCWSRCRSLSRSKPVWISHKPVWLNHKACLNIKFIVTITMLTDVLTRSTH